MGVGEERGSRKGGGGEEGGGEGGGWGGWGVGGWGGVVFFFQAEDGIRDYKVTGVQTCALPICMFPVNSRFYDGETRCMVILAFL